MALSGFGRFSEPALLVLISLLGGARHGYAISDDIERLTGNRPGPGTLYGAIGRLEARGLIAAEPDSGRRKPYRLTGTGRAEVTSALDELAALHAEATRRLRAAPA